MESENSSNEDILNIKSRSLNATANVDNIDDLVFRNPSTVNSLSQSAVEGTVTSLVPIEKKSHHLNEHNKKLLNIKGLQRKLEQKVERAKKNFLQNEKLSQLENEIVSSIESFEGKRREVAFNLSNNKLFTLAMRQLLNFLECLAMFCC